MRKILAAILLVQMFMLVGCSGGSSDGNGPITPPNDNSEIVMTKLNEYIDIDQDTVKFLFRTTIGATVEIYLGDDQNNLKLVKTVSNYNFNNGLKVDNIAPGKKYYRIVASLNGKSLQSPVMSLQKLADVDTDKVAQWAHDSVFYEVFIRAFYDSNGDGIGDFKGLKTKIPYLKELGVDALWLMPCFASPSSHGYDVSDYYQIEPDYGTMQDFQDFLAAAHQNGIKVILDFVVNHTSSQNSWFQQANQAVSNIYRDYYTWADVFDNTSETSPIDTRQHAWYKTSDSSYYYAIFWDQMPDLNLHNYEVRNEMKKVAKFWLDKGVDGFRLDAAMHIDDKDMGVTHNWWQEFNAYVKSINPDAFLVGENWESTDIIAPFFKDIDSSFNFPLASIFINMANGRQIDLISYIQSMYSQYSQYSSSFIDATFLTNHDINRVGSFLGGNAAKEKLAGALMLTSPGTPFIYYGEEIGQNGLNSDGSNREAMDWYTSAGGTGMANWRGNWASSTRANDGISVQEQDNTVGSLLEYYKKLIKIRKENQAFFNGNYARVSTPSGTYGYTVSGSLTVIHNLMSSNANIDVSANSMDLLTDRSYAANSSLPISAYGTVILKNI